MAEDNAVNASSGENVFNINLILQACLVAEQFIYLVHHFILPVFLRNVSGRKINKY